MKRLINEIKIFLFVRSQKRIKRNMIKTGHCKPVGHAVNYPKQGVEVVKNV